MALCPMPTPHSTRGEQLADAEAKGIRLIDKTPRKGAEGMTIAFLHPKSTQGILTELCENKNK